MSSYSYTRPYSSTSQSAVFPYGMERNLNQPQVPHQSSQQPYDPSHPTQQYAQMQAYPSHAMQPQGQQPGQQSSQQQAPPGRSRTPPPKIGNEDGYTYELSVEQSPIRARMCGFGDKDRRPITPPPCVRLIIRDRAGQEVKYEDIDPTWFVVTVDLWSPDAQNEINLVRHSATSPSISSTTAASYPPQPAPQPHFPNGAPLTQVHLGMTTPGQHPQSYYVQEPYNTGHHHAYQQDHSRPYYGNAGNPYGGMQPGMQHQGGMLTPNPPVMPIQDPRSAPSGMFTRNLIGSLGVSAFKLEDHEKKLGIWFILQDLSVRTEGSFRLKFSFVNVSNKANPTQVTTSKAPVLATCFSQIFQVFSAKKFPGVIESTKLSKCFAAQGIKIPIRKDGQNGRGDGDDEGD